MSQTVTATAVPSVKSPAASNARGALLASFVAPKASASRVVTAAELAVNCGIGSDTGRAWAAVHGHVFDITDFSKVHPGGTQIRLAAGRDATCLAESYHPNTSLPRLTAALSTRCPHIGVLEIVDEQSKAVKAYARPDDSFFVDVSARVDKLIHEKLGATRHTYDFVGELEALITVSLYAFGTYMIGVHGSWLWVLIMGFLTGRMGFLMHMATHCAISRSPRRNRLIGLFMDIIGSNATIWGYEHQVAHHGEPNEIHHDNDCEIGAPIVRMHPEIPHTPPMVYQHIIIPIAMTIGLLKWYAGDFGHFLRKHVGNISMAIDGEDWKGLLAFKAMWFVAHVILPVYYQGLGLGLLQMFLFMAIGGHYLENIFIVNHIQNGLVPPPDAHWASKQVLATSNWASGSVFWNWFSGGLNHQVEHHMFPALSHWWYPHIAATVKACCADHGLPYEDYASFPTAWIAMFTYLRDLGQVDFVSKTGQKGAPPVDKKQA